METDYWDKLQRQSQRSKDMIAVTVLAVHSTTGPCSPLFIKWADGRLFKIEEVVDVKPNGLAIINYKVKIKGQQRILYLRNNMWFIESKR